MKNSKFHITPEIDSKAKLVTVGPYKHIRHPMYTALIITCFGLLAINPNLTNILFYIILVLVLIIKAFYEELLLKKHFSNYKKYTKKTKRLIPFIF